MNYHVIQNFATEDNRPFFHQLNTSWVVKLAKSSSTFLETLIFPDGLTQTDRLEQFFHSYKHSITILYAFFISVTTAKCFQNCFTPIHPLYIWQFQIELRVIFLTLITFGEAFNDSLQQSYTFVDRRLYCFKLRHVRLNLWKWKKEFESNGGLPY